ncbi:MAG: zinc-ribbon domain-containing protein [Proteobacteria bacterium]|nr:zinc-ribbon domain-containing protein [Pseudomonadota bacterium]
MKDKILLCIQCEEPFVFSSEDQARFLTLGFASPRRCPECRKKKSKGIEHHEKWGKKMTGKNMPSGVISGTNHILMGDPVQPVSVLSTERYNISEIHLRSCH